MSERMYVLLKLTDGDWNYQDTEIEGLFTTLEAAQQWAVANGAEPKWTMFEGGMLKADAVGDCSDGWAIESHPVRA